MNVSMINSLVGMHAYQQKIDTIANNISNINTIGYKSRDVFFQEILTNRLNQLDDFKLNGRMTPLGLDKGYGARTSLTQGNFTQGQPQQTGIQTDMMLSGDNVFFTTSPTILFDENQLRYTRNGHFQLDGTGYLVTDQGSYVLNTDGDAIQIPEGANFSVDESGRVIAEFNDGSKEELGSLQITKINTPQALEDTGNNNYKIPQVLLDAGIDIKDNQFNLADNNTNNTTVIQGSLEAANVDMAKEMVELNEAQRAYQFLSKGIMISDQMLGIANNIKG